MFKSGKRNYTLTFMIALIAIVTHGCIAGKTVRAEHPELPAKMFSALERPKLGATDSILEMIKDKQAEKLVNEALKNNYDIRAAALRIKSFGFLLAVTAAENKPTVEAGHSITRTNQTSTGRIQYTQKVSVALSWEVDLWGRIADQYAAELNTLYAEKQDMERAADSLAARVLQSYFLVKSNWKKVELSKKKAEIHESIRNSIMRSYKSGLTQLDELSFADYKINSAMSDIESAVLEYENSVRELETLMGRYPKTELKLSGNLPLIPAPNSIAPITILNNRPDIQAASKRYDASLKTVSYANKAKLPNLVLSADFFRENESLTRLGATANSWGIVGDILYPILNREKIKNKAKAAEAESEAAYMDYAATVLNAMKEAENTFSKEKFLRNQLSYLKKAYISAQKSSAYYEKRYKDGIERLMVLQTAREQEIGTEIEILDIRTGIILNRIEMALALGTGVHKKVTNENQ